MGFPKNIILILLIVIVIILVAISGFIYYGREIKEKELTNLSEQEITGDGIAVKAELAKSLINPNDIVLEKYDVEPQISQYNLPINTKEISNYSDFSGKIEISSKGVSLLEKNGFVVFPTPNNIAELEVYTGFGNSTRKAKPKDDFVAYYQVLKNKDIPILITSDSLLHYYHIFFDTTLMNLERDIFYDDIWKISKELLENSITQYNSAEGDLKEAFKRNTAYLSVALEMLRPKNDQVVSDQTLREEYCSGYSFDNCKQILDGVKDQYGEKTSFKYFSQIEASDYNFKIPVFVKKEVEEELELIEKHEGWKNSPIFFYEEDYSQYIPRGHYTKTEKLKNYFKAVMWYGRMTALIEGSPDLKKGEAQCTGPINGIISQYDAEIQTIQALLISAQFSESKDIQDKWQRIYAITSFFTGFSDDLGPYEYSAVLNNIFKEKINISQIKEKYQDIKKSLSELPFSPKIYSGLGNCQLYMPCPPLSDENIDKLKIQAKKLLDETKGFRLLGQRFTIDSWLFSEIVSPYSGEYNGENLPLPTDEKPFTFSWDDNYPNFRNNRPFSWSKTDVAGCPPPGVREVKGFPRGLDIMAIFGSQRAKEILDETGDSNYSDYDKKFSELKESIDSLSNDQWFKSLYWNWLYVLKSLNKEFGKGYQTFMQTKAWQDKELATTLASWTELRHDTLLYVKQSYTMAELGAGGPIEPVVGYVEPVPEFYSRLLTLTKMTNKGLKNLVSEEEMEKLKIETSLNKFADILTKLLDISIKELENKELTKEEYYFIEDFGTSSENLIELVSGGVVDPDIFKTTMIADVHTDGNTGKVLEEGVGDIKTLVTAYKMPAGYILIGAGPVFSYYEFKQKMEERLTDETWRQLLKLSPPPEPSWIKSFSE
ncbi:MAG: DUF3160 domain-containing protein [Candidatus Nealsonbacteria bacterium]